MNIEFHLRTVGVLLLFLAAISVVYPKRFSWQEELSRLSLLNRQIFVVHCLFILLMLVMMGVLSLCFTSALTQPTPLGVLVLAGLCLFWSVRLVFQWFVYDRKLWVGHRFNTIVHFVFTGVWIYISAIYAWGLCLQISGSGA